MRSFTDEAAAVVCQTASILRETALLSFHCSEKIPFPRRGEADWRDIASQPWPLRFSFSGAKCGLLMWHSAFAPAGLPASHWGLLLEEVAERPPLSSTAVTHNRVSDLEKSTGQAIGFRWGEVCFWTPALIDQTCRMHIKSMETWFCMAAAILFDQPTNILAVLPRKGNFVQVTWFPQLMTREIH